MATYVPAKRGTEYIFYVGLVSQADTKLLKANPTLASGDFQVSKDGGTLANLTTLPTVTPASGRMVKITLSATEMTADNVTVVCSDASGAEWCDLIINIQTAARQIDDLAYPATSGRSMVVDAAGLVDANTVKVGPSGSGTAQTAGDIMADTNDIQSRLPAALVSGRIDASVGAMAANVLTATAINADAITAAKVAADVSAEIADAVWDEAIAGHLGAGSTGEKLNAAGSAGDPWTTALPGAYGAGTAGKIVGDNLNATVSSRSTLDAAGVRTAVGLAAANLDTQLTAIDDYIDTEVTAIKAKTDQLTFTAANKVDASLQSASDLVAAVANKIADHVLRRTYANARASSDGDAVSFRSLLGAIAKLVNKWSISGATLTVYHEDDATSAGTQAVTGTAGADPITTLDTA